MIKSMVISRIFTHYSMLMALKAADHKLRTTARAGRVPIIVGIVAGAVTGWLIAGFLGVLIGGVVGLIIIDTYRQ